MAEEKDAADHRRRVREEVRGQVKAEMRRRLVEAAEARKAAEAEEARRRAEEEEEAKERESVDPFNFVNLHLTHSPHGPPPPAQQPQ